MVCFYRPYHFKLFKRCLSQISLGPFLNTLSHFYSLSFCGCLIISAVSQKKVKKNLPCILVLSNVEKILEKLVYERVYNFLTENNIIYNLQFGFRQKFSASHALINLTEKIRQALDEGYIGCGISVDLQKAFGKVDHEILLPKLDYYGIRGISNNWFKSYLSNQK